jgi:hypothetical protein
VFVTRRCPVQPRRRLSASLGQGPKVEVVLI